MCCYAFIVTMDIRLYVGDSSSRACILLLTFSFLDESCMLLIFIRWMSYDVVAWRECVVAYSMHLHC